MPNTGTFQLRDSVPADFETLWRIDQDCFPAGISYSRAELRAYLRRRGSFTLVAMRNPLKKDKLPARPEEKDSPSNHLAGFIIAECYRRAGHIITIDVVAAARRQGLGSLLLRGAEERLRTLGCASIELETAVDNPSALAFYKRHGYSVSGTLPRYYSNGVDALALRKVLST